MEVSVQLHAPAALPAGWQPQCPLDMRLGGPQNNIWSLLFIFRSVSLAFNFISSRIVIFQQSTFKSISFLVTFHLRGVIKKESVLSWLTPITHTQTEQYGQMLLSPETFVRSVNQRIKLKLYAQSWIKFPDSSPPNYILSERHKSPSISVSRTITLIT